MKKSYSNGVSSQRTRALTLWFWICPCLIRAGEKTLWEHFSRILCFKCCPLWQKTSAPISDSGKQRVSRQQRRGVCALGDHHAPCRITFMLFIRGGVPGKLPAQQPQRVWYAPCDLSLPGRNLRKSQIIVNRRFYRKVYFPVNRLLL